MSEHFDTFDDGYKPFDPDAAKPFDLYYFGDPDAEPNFPVPPAIIEGFLYHGLICATGKWKETKKTITFVTASSCIHTGKPFLGRAVEQQPVLWVQWDTPQANFLEYCRQIQGGMGYPKCKILWIGVDSREDLTRMKSQARLLRTIEVTGARTIILDCARSMSTTPESENDDVSRFVRDFLGAHIRDKLGANVIVIPHPPKHGRSVRGAGEWGAAGDSVLALEKKDGGAIHVTGLGRHPDVDFKYCIDLLEAHDGGWRLREIQTADTVDGKENSTQRILDFLKRENR